MLYLGDNLIGLVFYEEETMKEKLMGSMEKFAKAMVQPLMYLSVAGMVLILGVLITNTTVTNMLPFLKWWPIQLIGNLIYQCIMVIINNLSIVFCVGISAALGKKDKQQAAMIGLLSYFMFLTANNITLKTFGMLAEPTKMLGLVGTGQASVLGIQVLDTGVFGGTILGCVCGYVFNRTKHVTFKSAMMQIYSGVRFSFFVMMVVSMIIGWGAVFIWPFVQHFITALTSVISGTGNFGLFLYGFLERILIPTGLHHLVYAPFQFSDVGGVIHAGGHTYAGAYPIVMYEMSNPAVLKFSDSIYYMATGFIKTYAYIGIGAAFYFTAYKENKKKTAALLIPLVLTACLANITEPLDFLFAFAAPLLFIVHAILAGVFIVILKLLCLTPLMNGGLINSTIMNIVMGPAKTGYPLYFVIGILMIITYFLIFTFLIKKFKMHTPGREKIEEASDDVNKAEASMKDIEEQVIDVKSIIAGLGGKDNIIEVENCFTRLRVHVKDVQRINEEMLQVVKHSGIVKKGNDIQIVYGLQVPQICSAVQEALSK